MGWLTVGQCDSLHDSFSTNSGVNYLPTTKPARRHSTKVSRKAVLTHMGAKGGAPTAADNAGRGFSGVLPAHSQAQNLPRRTIHVFVALAGNQNQGIVPLPARLGNGLDPYPVVFIKPIRHCAC
jgi:hypothetical protein